MSPIIPIVGAALALDAVRGKKYSQTELVVMVGALLVIGSQVSKKPTQSPPRL